MTYYYIIPEIEKTTYEGEAHGSFRRSNSGLLMFQTIEGKIDGLTAYTFEQISIEMKKDEWLQKPDW